MIGAARAFRADNRILLDEHVGRIKINIGNMMMGVRAMWRFGTERQQIIGQLAEIARETTSRQRR